MANATADLVDHFHDREPQDELIHARLVDVTGKAGQLGAASLGNAQVGKSLAAIADDGRYGAQRLDVVQDGGTLERPHDGWERWPDPGYPPLALERLQQRRFLPTLIGARAGVCVEIKVEARSLNIRAEPAPLIGFAQRLVEDVNQVAIFAAHVDIARVRADREPG